MNNRKWNAKNPCQGNALKVLCVCSAGLLRSPTVANVLANDPYYFNTRSVGLEQSFALIPIDDVLLEWADVAICMEDSQCVKVRDMGFTGEIYDFNIDDSYDFMDNRLVEIIKNRTDGLENWLWSGGS